MAQERLVVIGGNAAGMSVNFCLSRGMKQKKQSSPDSAGDRANPMAAEPPDIPIGPH